MKWIVTAKRRGGGEETLHLTGADYANEKECEKAFNEMHENTHEFNSCLREPPHVVLPVVPTVVATTKKADPKK